MILLDGVSRHEASVVIVGMKTRVESALVLSGLAVADNSNKLGAIQTTGRLTS
jgi:hypothetical protein